MPFKKGDPLINRNGRPKGKEDNSTLTLRGEWKKKLLEEETPHFKERLKETKGLSYWKAINILASRCLPALQNVEIDQDINLEGLLRLSSQERRAVIESLQQKLNAK